MSGKLIPLVLVIALSVGLVDAGEVTGLRAAHSNEWQEIEASVAARISGVPPRSPAVPQAQPKPPPAMPVVIGYAGAGGQGVATIRLLDGSVREVIVGDVLHGRSIVFVAPGKVVSTGKDGPQTWIGPPVAK